VEAIPAPGMFVEVSPIFVNTKEPASQPSGSLCMHLRTCSFSAPGLHGATASEAVGFAGVDSACYAIRYASI